MRVFTIIELVELNRFSIHFELHCAHFVFLTNRLNDLLSFSMACTSANVSYIWGGPTLIGLHGLASPSAFPRAFAGSLRELNVDMAAKVGVQLDFVRGMLKSDKKSGVTR